MKLKTLFLCILVTMHGTYHGSAQQGIPAPGQVGSVDIDGDGQIDIVELVEIFPFSPTINEVFYNIGTKESAYLLKGRSNSGGVAKGDRISASGFAISDLLNLQDYVAENLPSGWVYLLSSSPNSLVRNTNVFFGVRLDRDDGHHFGWVQLSRPDSGITTAFTITDYGYNPVPGEAIQAGLPPSLPQIATEMTTDGLRLSWSSALIGWNLQSAESLRLPVQWNDLGSGATNAIIPLEGATRYFRLIKP
jgi:hypothetical protein